MLPRSPRTARTTRLRSGTTLLRAGPTAALLVSGTEVLRIEGIPFPDVADQMADPRRPALFDQLGSNGLGGRAVLWLSEADLQRRLGAIRKCSVRLGPLRACDVDRAASTLFVQIGGPSWRVGPVGPACHQCLALRDLERQRVPQPFTRLMNQPPRGAFLAIARSDLARLAGVLGGSLIQSPRRGRRGAWLVGRFGSPHVVERRLGPAPGCIACARDVRPALPATVAPDRSAPAVLLSKSLRRLGIHARIWYRAAPGSRTLHRLPIVRVSWAVASRSSDKRKRFWSFHNGHTGSGATLEKRLITGRAEVLERASGVLRRPDVLRRSRDLLPGPSLPPRLWGLYSQEQYRQPDFPYPPVGRTDLLDWLWAEELGGGGRILVPADLTFTSSTARPRRIVSSSTNGLVIHTDPDVARLSGLYEVLERDALVRAWYGGGGAWLLDPRRLDLAGVEDIRRWFADEAWKVTLSHLRGRGGVEVVIAIAEKTRDSFPLKAGGSVFASAASLAVSAAAAHALRELQMMAEGVALFPPKSLARELELPPDLSRVWMVRDLMDIVRLYLKPAMRPALGFFRKGPPRRRADRPTPSGPDRQLGCLVGRLRREGLRPLVVDMTRPLTPELVALQVLVPGTQPLAFGVGAQRLGTGILPGLLPQRAPAAPPASFSPPVGRLNPYPLPLA
jgi:ribosomal protein S12 methylthiotransferase accessory factor